MIRRQSTPPTEAEDKAELLRQLRDNVRKVLWESTDRAIADLVETEYPGPTLRYHFFGWRPRFEVGYRHLPPLDDHLLELRQELTCRAQLAQHERRQCRRFG